MPVPRIGRSVQTGETFEDITFDEKPVPQAPPQAPSPATAAEAEIYGVDLEHLLQPISQPPNPPSFITKGRDDRMWRWLSVPQVKVAGMRNYTTYSPDADEKKRIDAGFDVEPGIFVDAENKVRWREDAFLAWIPRRLYELRMAQRRARTDAQTKLAKEASSMRVLADKVGGKVMYKVDQWDQKGE